MKNSMYEVAVALAKKQTTQIDTFSEDAVLVSREIPFQAATHGIKNVFERVKDVTAPAIVDLDSPMPLVTAVTELGETPLFKIGGTIEMPKDKVEAMGGKTAYLASKLPAILKLAGAQLDKAVYYDVLLRKALQFGKVINAKSSATASQKQYYSLVAIHWANGENVGLYNNNRDNGQEGTFFAQNPLWGGNLGKLSDGATGWAVDLTAMLGFQIENHKYIDAIVNIDADNLPSYEQLISIPNRIRGNANNSRIYANPTLIDLISAKYSRASGEGSYSSLITVDADGNVRIKGIPVIGDYNILEGTEPGIPANQINAA